MLCKYRVTVGPLYNSCAFVKYLNRYKPCCMSLYQDLQEDKQTLMLEKN